MTFTDAQLEAMENYIMATIDMRTNIGIKTARKLKAARQDLQDSFADMFPSGHDKAPALELPITPGLYRSRDGTDFLVVYIRPDVSAYRVIGFIAYTSLASCPTTMTWTLEGRYHFDLDAGPNDNDLVQRIGDLP